MAWGGKNVLVTGATHFIAGHLSQKLVTLRWNCGRVRMISKMLSPRPGNTISSSAV